MILYESIYLRIVQEVDKNILNLFWKEDTFQMDENAYKLEMLKLREIAHQLRPIGIFSDNTFFLFPISPSLHLWIREHIFSHIQDYFKKLAVIESEDIFSRISVEMTLEEYLDRHYEIQFFPEFEKQQAFDWLNEN